MEDKNHRISTNFLGESFQEFLKEENNTRILFSAKFGMGKTTFLKEFFAGKEDYEIFHLFPVNYQICTNEKIMDYIKADILVHLCSKYKEEKGKELLKSDFQQEIKSIFNTQNLKSAVLKVLDIIAANYLGKDYQNTQ